MIDFEKERVIDEILCIFETSQLSSPEAYSTVAILDDKAGISYGKHQATDLSGSLDAVLWRYVDLQGSYAADIRPYLDELAQNETVPVPHPPWVATLMVLLARAGKDPVMQRAQNEIFDERYWFPAMNQAESMGLTLPLSFAVIYDSYIQGGLSKVRAMFPEKPPARGGDEKTWVRVYLNHRGVWLSQGRSESMRNSVYRPQAFLKLIQEDNWELNTPLVVRGLTIS